MKTNSFLFIKFIIIAISMKFIWNSLFITFILSTVFYYLFKDDLKINIKLILIGLILGIESGGLYLLFDSLAGSVLITNIFRNFGFDINNSIAYSTMIVLNFSYIVVFELLFVIISSKLGKLIIKFLSNYKYIFQ